MNIRKIHEQLGIDNQPFSIRKIHENIAYEQAKREAKELWDYAVTPNVSWKKGAEYLLDQTSTISFNPIAVSGSPNADPNARIVTQEQYDEIMKARDYYTKLNDAQNWAKTEWRKSEKAYIDLAKNQWIIETRRKGKNYIPEKIVGADDISDAENNYGVDGDWDSAAILALKQIYEEKGIPAARQFAKEYNYAIETGAMEDYAKKHPVLGSLLSLGTNVLGEAETLLNYYNYATDPGIKELRRSKMADYTNALRSGTMQVVDVKVGDWDAFDFTYSTGMSLGDVAVSALLTRGLGLAGKAASTMTGVMLGLSAAGNTANSILDRGGTSQQAFYGGLVAGTFEGIFEKFSLGQLKGFKNATAQTFKQSFKNVGGTSVKTFVKEFSKDLAKSVGVNFTEEFATETANILYDTFVLGDISNYAIAVENYIKNGMTEEDARAQAASDLALQTIEAGASGALMGAVYGPIGTVSAYKGAKKALGYDTKPKTYQGIKELSAAPDKKDAFQKAMENAGGYETLSKDQKSLKTLGQVIGVKVKFANLDVKREDGSLFSPDGQYDKDTNTITLNTSEAVKHNPVAFVLKHEITHSIENLAPERYADLASSILNSNLFRDWVQAEKGFDTVEEYRADIMRRYTEQGVKGFEGQEGQVNASKEMVANFVGDVLFGGREDIATKLINGMAPKQKKTFIEWVKDIFKTLQQKFSGNVTMAQEIDRLENLFLDAARETKSVRQNKSAQTETIAEEKTETEKTPEKDKTEIKEEAKPEKEVEQTAEEKAKPEKEVGQKKAKANKSKATETAKTPVLQSNAKDQQKTTTEEGSGVQYSYPGESSRTADKSLLAEALDLSGKGKSADYILEKTGWFKGGDGKWRYLISDKAMEFYPNGFFTNPDVTRYRELQLKYIIDTENMSDEEIAEMRSLSKNLAGVNTSPTFLDQFITHDELFAAYPQLKNVKLRFDKLEGNEGGHYNANKNEIVVSSKFRENNDKAKDILIHEIQHAIQHIEGFANGGNLELAKQLVFNRAYELVKNSNEFKALSPEGKVDYILNSIYERLNVNNIDDAARKVYEAMYGEIESREVSKNRNKTLSELKKEKPFTDGVIYDIAKTKQEYLDVLSEIGYTERQINQKFGSEVNDQSRSSKDVQRRVGRAEDRSEVSDDVRRVRDNSLFGYRKGSRTESSNMGRGVRSDVANERENNITYSLPESDRIPVGSKVRAGDRGNIGTVTYYNETLGEYTVSFTSKKGATASKTFPVSMLTPLGVSSTKGKSRSTASRVSAKNLIEKYDRGEITQDEVVNQLRESTLMNPVEIANLTPEDADTTPDLKPKEDRSIAPVQALARKKLGVEGGDRIAAMIEDFGGQPRSDLIDVANNILENLPDKPDTRKKEDKLLLARRIRETEESLNRAIKKVKKDYGTRKSWESFSESDIITDEVKDLIAKDGYIQNYGRTTNKRTLGKALELLEEEGRERVEKFMKMPPEEANAVDVAVGLILLERYQRAGKFTSAQAVAQKLSEIGTISGQTVQIFSVIGRFSPEMMVQYAQRELDKAFEILVENKTKAWVDKHAEEFQLTPEDVDFIKNCTIVASQLEDGSRMKAVLLAQASQRVSDKIPPSAGDSIRAFQRISLLLNFRTFGRNLFGNVSMIPAYVSSDFFGNLIDKQLAKKSNIRTTGNVRLGDKDLGRAFWKGAVESWDDFKRGIRTRQEELNRFDVNVKQGKAFNENHEKLKILNGFSRAANALDNFTSFTLELGDRPFFEMWLVNSLKNQMALNKTDTPTAEMLEIAKQEALQRTWQDNNRFTRSLMKLKETANNFIHIPGTNYGLGDLILKFVKTPANISKAIIEFSPIGGIKAIANARRYMIALEKGNLTPAMQKEFVRTASNAITGSLLYILVAVLASVGAIELSGAGDEDKDVSNFEKYIAGVYPYSMKIGGVWVPYEWNQPIGAVLAAVADIMDNADYEHEGWEDYANDAWNAMKAAGTVFTQQSFLQNLEELFAQDGIVEGFVSVAASEPSVFIPQLLSQIASFTDPYRRTTYDSNFFTTILNSAMNRIPGLRQMLPEQVNVLGEEAENTQFLNPWLAFASPYNLYPKVSGEVASELYELYKDTSDNGVIPPVVQNSFTVKGVEVTFTPEEKADFQKKVGKLSADILEEMFDSDEYKKLDDEQKIKAVKAVYSYATDKAKTELDIFDYDLVKEMEGKKSNGDYVLTKDKWNRIGRKGQQILIDEYFLTKKQRATKGDTKKLAEMFIESAADK